MRLRDARAAPVAALRERPVERHDDARRAGGPRALDPRQDLRRACPTSTAGRRSWGWPRRPPRPACWRTRTGPSPCPRAAAARATATSPSGCTACTPVGEMSTGRSTATPMTVVDRSRDAGEVRDVRREAELGERVDVVLERRARARSRRPAPCRPTSAATSCARRCASATVSNQRCSCGRSGSGLCVGTRPVDRRLVAGLVRTADLQRRPARDRLARRPCGSGRATAAVRRRRRPAPAPARRSP